MSYAIDPETITATVTGTVTIGSPLVSGAVKTAIYDVHGQAGEFSQVRDLRTCEPFRLVGSTFEGTTVDTNFWTASQTGTGAGTTQAAGLVTLASGTTNSGYAQLSSVRKGRFIFAHPNIYRGAVRIPTVVVADNTRRWGAFATTTAPTPTDGFYFELSAAGVLSVNSRNAGGSVNSVASGSFNGEVAAYVVDTNVHVYEIHYYVMGVEFYVDQTLVHNMTPTTANLSSTYTLPVNMNTVNAAGGTTSGTIECLSANMVREGRSETTPTYVTQSGTNAGLTLKRSAGQLRGIILSNISANAVVTLYDNTTAAAPTIWASGTMPAQAVPFALAFDEIQFFTGLTLAITGAACDATVIYE